MGLGNKEDQGKWKQKSTAFPHFTINSTVWKLAFRKPVSEIKNQNTNHKRYFSWTVSPFYSIQLMWAEPINTPLSLFAFHMAYKAPPQQPREPHGCVIFLITPRKIPFHFIAGHEILCCSVWASCPSCVQWFLPTPEFSLRGVAEQEQILLFCNY